MNKILTHLQGLIFALTIQLFAGILSMYITLVIDPNFKIQLKGDS